MADITSKTLAKSVEAGNEPTVDSPATVLKTTIAEFKAPETSAVKTAEEKELAAELQKEAILRQAKEAAVPVLLAQEETRTKSSEVQIQEKNVTVIADKGVVNILTAKLIAQELPKDDGLGVKDGTGHQIDGLSSATATHGMNPEHAHAEGRVV